MIHTCRSDQNDRLETKTNLWARRCTYADFKELMKWYNQQAKERPHHQVHSQLTKLVGASLIQNALGFRLQFKSDGLLGRLHGRLDSDLAKLHFTKRNPRS